MKNIKILLMKISLVVVMLFHLSMHVLYLAPVNPATPRYSKITDSYMGSFFTQNWHLFAPEPATSSLNLLFRCSTTSEWINPLTNLLTDHKTFPLTAKGKQTYVLQHLAREIFNAKLNKKVDSEIRELPVLQQYIQDNCGKYSQAEVEIQRRFTQDYSKRFLEKSGQSQTFKFVLQTERLVWN
ncbi:MAG: DUF5819 family protein [Bdellovibrio sp.]